MERHDSVHAFPGDTHVSEEQYRACIDHRCISSASTVGKAARACEVEVDTETFERWKRTAAAVGFLDEFSEISRDPESIYNLCIQGACYFQGWSEMPTIPEGLDKHIESGAVLLGNAISALPQEQQREFRNAVEAMAFIVLWKAGLWHPENAADYTQPREFAELLKHEAKHTSQLLTETASETVREQPNFERFTTWCNRAITLGSLVHNTFNLKEEYERELVQVSPTLGNRIRIARHVGPSVMAMMRD